MSAKIRVELPQHLRTLAHVGHEVPIEVQSPVTQRSVLDALEARISDAPRGDSGSRNFAAAGIPSILRLSGRSDARSRPTHHCLTRSYPGKNLS